VRWFPSGDDMAVTAPGEAVGSDVVLIAVLFTT